MSQQTFKEKMNSQDQEDQLPVKNITNEQFFFVAFAQNYCKKRSPENVKRFLKTSKHSLEEIRVKGTVSQLEEFAEAFSCKQEAPMNPISKCLIW